LSKIAIWSGNKFPEYNPKNEWYTRKIYLAAAREVMGCINTDPASCEEANKNVKADVFYTQSQNGLCRNWYGNVWMNPPFVGGLSAWLMYLIRQYEIGNVKQAIALYPAASGVLSTEWFHKLLDYPLCIPHRRIVFQTHDVDGDAYKPISWQHPPFSCVFSYLGDRGNEFVRVFSRFGDIVGKIS
jgi:ParB family chromosome partitioning protein